MTTTRPTLDENDGNTAAAAHLLMATERWHATHPQQVVQPRPGVQARRVTRLTPIDYTITVAGRAALDEDPATDRYREPRARKVAA